MTSRTQPSRESPIIVIGAGVIGLAVGCELRRRGLPVTLLERSHPGAGASPIAAGMLAPTSEANLEHPDLIRYGCASLALWPAFAAELERETGISIGYRTDGTLMVALTRDDERELEHIERAQRAQSLPSRWLTPEELLEREPSLSPRVTGALWVEGDHHVDPRLLVKALVQRFAQLGGVLLAPRRVARLEPRDGQMVTVRGVDEADQPFSLSGSAVVNAAGAWATRDIVPPLTDSTVRPVRGQTVLLKGPPVLRHVIRHPEVYLVPRDGGEITVGGTVEEMGYSAVATVGGITTLLRWAREVVPALDDHEIIGLPVGLRPVVRDHLPLIGRGSLTGSWIAAAHYRNGILLAPITARDLADAMTTDTIPPRLEPFDPARLKPMERR